VTLPYDGISSTIDILKIKSTQLVIRGKSASKIYKFNTTCGLPSLQKEF
jgi:hypothetical protein